MNSCHLHKSLESTRILDHTSAREKFKGSAISNGREQSVRSGLPWKYLYLNISNTWISYYSMIYNDAWLLEIFIYIIREDDFISVSFI